MWYQLDLPLGYSLEDHFSDVINANAALLHSPTFG